MATASYHALRKNLSAGRVARAIMQRHSQRWYHPPPAVADAYTGLVVDLRSDTITKPTQGMKQAMMDALLGDDVYREDPTVKALEKRMAETTGKEAALFVPSGTMGNLISILGHCEHRGSEVLLGDQAHIFLYEQAGMAQIKNDMLGGVQPHIIPNQPDGTFDLREIEARFRDEDVHVPRTTLVCLENTHNVCGGKVIPLSWIDEVGRITKDLGIPLHMDGARLMNAVIASGESPARVLQACDTCSMCLSKGLGTPVGSVVMGTDQFIYKAVRLRKVLGGGMRQAGMLAAAGLFALDNMVERLAEDHRHAQQLAQGVSEMASSNVWCDPSEVHTNMAIVHMRTDVITPQEFCERLSVVSEEESREIGEVTIKVFPWTSDSVRFVTHYDVSPEGIAAAVSKLKFIIKEIDGQT